MGNITPVLIQDCENITMATGGRQVGNRLVISMSFGCWAGLHIELEHGSRCLSPQLAVATLEGGFFSHGHGSDPLFSQVEQSHRVCRLDLPELRQLRELRGSGPSPRRVWGSSSARRGGLGFLGGVKRVSEQEGDLTKPLFSWE